MKEKEKLQEDKEEAIEIKNNLECYKGTITRIKSKHLQFLEFRESSKLGTRRTLIMGDKEERNEVPENQEDIPRIPRTRIHRTSPVNLQGEQHPLPTLPQQLIPIFSGDGRVCNLVVIDFNFDKYVKYH